jgi:hypothetical protein
MLLSLHFNKYPLKFYRCTVHPEIYTVHSPTNAPFIKLGKILKFTLKYTQNIAPTCFGLRPSGSLY